MADITKQLITGPRIEEWAAMLASAQQANDALRKKEYEVEPTKKGLYEVTYDGNWLGEFRYKKDAEAFADLKRVQDRMKGDDDKKKK